MNGTREAAEALAAGRPALIWRKQIADTDTPVSAALKLIEPNRGDFLLESVEGGETRGRHSLIGLSPDLVFRAHGSAAELNRDWLTDRNAFAPLAGGALDALRTLAAECRMDVPAALPRALACLVGYFGYETVGLVEKLPRPPANPIALPDMLFVRPTLILIFDRLTDELHLVAPLWPDDKGTVEARIAAAIERIDSAAARLARPLPAARRPAEQLAGPEPQPVLPAGRYGEMVARAKD